MTKRLDIIDLILPGLAAQMNTPDANYDINDAALVAGVCSALKINPQMVWARLKAHCHHCAALQ
jgi:hypothetical protein